MKTKSLLVIALAVGFLAVLAATLVVWMLASGVFIAPSATQSEQYYTCGMHPEIIRNKPGNCPICGMKLTLARKKPAPAATNAPSASAGHDRKIKFYKSTMLPGEISQTQRKDSMGMDMAPVYEDSASDSATIAIDSVTTQNMGIRLGLVTTGPVRRKLRTMGMVDFDETTLTDVTTKFKGWIEKLYVDATGKQAHKGEPLFEIYSPELYSAQTEYLLALDHASGAPGSESLKTSALTKLKFFDISDEQIAELARSRQPKKTLQITAPRDGVVVDKMVVQGQMVDAGMKLYRLADLGLVWVVSQVYEQDLPFLKLGQEAFVRLSYFSDREFRGRVTYIYPTLDEKTRTAKVRMEFHNPGFFLKPGMFATAELQAELDPTGILVPDTAVLRSGEKNTVFVALEGGRFEPRTIILGARAENDFYQVLSGLDGSEKVVVSGQFMLDSESQLREAIQKMQKPAPADATNSPLSPSSSLPGHPHPPSPPERTSTFVYICPMPEHVAITYNRPGPCPICGMALVPVSAASLAKLAPGGRVQFYTCPMPEHDDIQLDKPGKCPKCGMTLIPVMEPPPFPAANGKPSPAPALYTCPMAEHAHVVSDKPGKCPECNMTLVRTTEVQHGKSAEANYRPDAHSH